MSLAVDDIKPGDWIVIHYRRPHVSRDMLGNEHQEFVTYSGSPIRVDAINLPFMAVQDGPTGNICTVDVREVAFVRATSQYVKALQKPTAKAKQANDQCDCEACRALATESGNKSSSMADNALDSFPCPRCGGKLTKQSLGGGRYRIGCEKCGSTGEAAVLPVK